METERSRAALEAAKAEALALRQSEEKLRKEGEALRSQLTAAQLTTRSTEERARQIETTLRTAEEEKKKRRKDRWLKLIKNSFDMIPSGKESKILEIIFNRVIP